mgnify:CR=1 FL=1
MTDPALSIGEVDDLLPVMAVLCDMVSQCPNTRAVDILPQETGMQSPRSSALTEHEVYVRVIMRLCVRQHAMWPWRKQTWSKAYLWQPLVEL